MALNFPANANVGQTYTVGTTTWTWDGKSWVGGQNSITVSGNITGAYIIGNGSALSSITGANVVGAVPSATLASSLESNLSNVIIYGGSNGQVLTTDGSGVLSWSTVTAGNSAYANSANYANYSGESNVANVAYSVDVANVANIGNVATINLDGNVSNVLSGNGTWVPLTGGNGNASTGDFTFANNSINTANTSNITLNITGVGGKTWIFSTAGDFTSPGNVVGANFTATGNITFNNWANTPGGTNMILNPGTSQIRAIAHTEPYHNDSWRLGADGARWSTVYANAGNFSGVLAANRITLTSTGTAVDASQGNILTNQVTGTRFNFLSGLYTISLSAGVSTANYTLTLPGNAGSNGQVLVGDGTGALSWSSSIANANYASFANIANVANSVVGSNVTGEVANANFATYSSTANSAQNVAGANVTGQVANANYASYSGTAYSVSGSNVSGEVANANYASYAGTAYSVGGSNVSGQVANANYASYSNTVVGAAQPNITSLGNLTSLQINGQLNGVDALFTGNLVVQGNVTYTSTSELVVQDPIIDLGAGPNGAPLTGNDGKDRGLYMHVFDTGANAEVNKFLGWNVANGEFTLASNATVANSVVTVNQLGNVRAAYFIGDGSQLSNINIGNAVVANANYASSANVANVANSVSGANVSGEVANANYAVYSGTAYSVSGSNVTGEVANANYAQFSGTANVANSVAAANIVGEVANANFATYSLYSNTANWANSASALDAAVANVRITGGSNGYVLSTDGTGNLSWTSNETGEPIANALIASTQYPMGFDEATKLTGTTISFDDATRTFTIAPTGATFSVWVQGTQYTKTTESIAIGNTTGAWYLYYAAGGTLTASTTPWTIDQVAVISYVYWNSTLGAAQMFFDERHGTSMDAATHEYLHLTRGASIVYIPELGFTINATTTGSGDNASDAQIGISSGAFYDEDLRVDIVATASPTPDTWEQDLALPGNIPVLYRSNGAWTLDTATAYPVKFGVARPTYNLNTGGTWSTPDVTNNSYFVQWIVATNNLNSPVISIMGQEQYSSLATAQEATFSDLDLTSLPVAELRVLYGLVYQTSNGYTNAVKARIRSYTDVRVVATSSASLSVDGVDVAFRETPSTVFAADATANAAWSNIIGNFAGNISYTGSNVTLGNISNLHITGGNTGDLIRTDGAGNLSFVAPFSLSVGNLSASNGNAFITMFSNVTTLGFDEDSGFSVDDLGNGTIKIGINSTFKYWQVDGSPGLTAEGLDTVNFIAGSGITIAASNSASPKSLTISATGGGGGNATPGGTNTQIQFNDAGNFAGANGFSYDKTTNTVQITNTATGATGIVLGDPSQGNLVSNAVTLTNATSITNGIALLNQILGKLVPPSPPAFPASQSITIASLSTYRMANFVQTDNTPGANKSVAGGTTVTSVRRAAGYNANTITNAGPGDSGTITVFLNGANAGARTLTANLDGNGTYSNLVIFNNYDYNTANSNITAGFWSVFSARAAGTVSAGWNEVYIRDSATANTNTPSWYYDSSTPGTPTFSNTSISVSSSTLLYTSTVPHYTSATQFTLTFDVNRLSGDMYPTSDTFATGTAGGAFQAPASKTYAGANITTPLARNLYVSSGNVTVTTTANITTGFGSSSTGPSISVVNSYNTGTNTFSPGVTVLYKTGTASTMEEANVRFGSTVGTGSGLAFRIINPGSSDTPAYSANATAFNSQTSTLEVYDATIVAASLKHDQTNYSTGYLPAGPNLSSGRTGSQYFTFKFVRTSVSKFDIKWTGTIAGLWIALPGSTIDSTSGLNGWLNMATAYAGAGVPGSNTGAGGNGSDGAALGGVAPLNAAQVNKSVTATFGTVSSSSTATNEIYVRVKLTSGQSVTALSLETASN